MDKFRGRIELPQEENEETHRSKEEITREADEIIARRSRGRIVEGKVVPFEDRKKELEEKVTSGKVLSPKEEGELNELILKLEGPLMERVRRPKK